jgi:IclR family transcriptional regulator, KDG regulon repressor
VYRPQSKARIPFSGGRRACKSGIRVLELLEYFNKRRCPLSLKELVEALRCPVSSVDDLLKMLAEGDYLSFDPVIKTYTPTIRTQKLSTWYWPEDTEKQRIHDMICRIHDRTGENCLVATANDLYLHRVDAVIGEPPDDYKVSPDNRTPLVVTGVGWAWIAACGDRAAERLYRRSVAKGLVDRRSFTLKLFQHCVEACRQSFSLLPSVRYPGTSVITATLPQLPNMPRLYLGVTGRTARLENNCGVIAQLISHEMATSNWVN